MTRLIYFSAAWCIPCRKFGPSLTAEAALRGLPILPIDIDADPDLAQAHNVMSVPTVVAVRDGEVVDRFGALGPMALRERLDRLTGTGAR